MVDDVILEIESINKLIKSGWKINYNENRKEIHKIIKEEAGINNAGNATIEGGTITATSYNAIYNTNAITITGGTVSSDYSGILNYGTSATIIIGSNDSTVSDRFLICKVI